MTTFLLIPLIAEAQPVTSATAVTAPPEAVVPETDDPARDEGLAKIEKTLKKLKITGYVQGRYVAHQDAFEGVSDDEGGEPDSFFIRRARVKFKFAANPWSEYVLYPSFDEGNVQLKEAYVDLKEQWTKTHALRFGQFLIPYGYEIELSSSSREVPERTRWERAVFSGERDRGAALYGDFGHLEYTAAVLNGNGIRDRDSRFKGYDNNFEKQYIGRVSLRAGGLSTGISGSHNTILIPEVVKTTTVPGHPNKEYTERAAGVYLVYERDLPVVGEFTLRGEYNRGWTAVFNDEFGTTKPGFLRPERRAKMMGWHVLVSQYFGESNQIAYRIDQFDPDLESRDKDCNTGLHVATDGCHLGRVTTHVMAWNFFWDKNVRITSALEIPRNRAYKDKRDMTWTEQIQYKF